MNRRQYKQVVKIIGKDCSNKKMTKVSYKFYKVGKYTIHGTAYYLGSFNSKEDAIKFADNQNIDYFVIEKVTKDSFGNDISNELV